MKRYEGKRLAIPLLSSQPAMQAPEFVSDTAAMFWRSLLFPGSPFAETAPEHDRWPPEPEQTTDQLPAEHRCIP